jgi:transcriptional regulator with XRE-family HTH domain
MYPNLKLAIFKRGLRQNHLAREVGIHEVILSKIIHGFREPSSAERLRLSEYLGAEESWLFEKYVNGNGAVKPDAPARSAPGTNRGNS